MGRVKEGAVAQLHYRKVGRPAHHKHDELLRGLVPRLVLFSKAVEDVLRGRRLKRWPVGGGGGWESGVSGEGRADGARGEAAQGWCAARDGPVGIFAGIVVRAAGVEVVWVRCAALCRGRGVET